MVIDIPRIPTVRPFGLPIQPFGVLVGIGLVVGYMLGRRRARLTGLNPDLCADGMVWTVVCGFILAHLVSVIFYFPDKIAENPLVLLYFWQGISSFGGFIGGVIGAFVYFRRHQASVLEYSDAILFGLLPGWIFGRLGCTLVKDHPGLPTTFFLAVLYPATKDFAAGPRHDLGFYEFLLTILLTGILYAVKGVRPFHGFHPAVMLFLYAPVRFMFDYLRTADKVYWGYTPGQFLAVGLFGFGIALVIYGLHLRRRGIAPGLSAPRAGAFKTAELPRVKGGAKKGRRPKR